MPKKVWKNAEKYAAVSSLIVSLLALGISTKSCQQADHSIKIAERAQKLSEEEFLSSRLATLKGTFDNKESNLMLSPHDSQINLQKASVFFPPQLESGSREVNPPEFKLSISYLKFALQKHLQERIPREKDHVMISPSFYVPVIIDSFYVAKGSAYANRSLYYIEYSFLMRDKENEPPSIDFNGLMFINTFDSQVEPNSYLSEEWEKRINSIKKS